MKVVQLHATARTILGKKVKRHRAKGQLPAVLFGHGFDSMPLFIELKEFKKAYQEAGTSALVDLAIEDQKPIKILLHEPQPHHLHNDPIHADLYAVKMTEKIETAIPINFTGVSLAVEELEGNFIANKDELQIRCLPADLIPAVDVDISVIKTFDDQIRVSDVSVPETVEILDDPEDVVALVAAPRTEEELEAELAEDKAAEAAAVEELGGDKEEAAEGEEGAAEAGEESTEGKDQDKDERPAE